MQVFRDVVTISKTDEDRNLVFGWASVAERDGIPVVDGEGDVIKAGTLEDAAYEFVLNFGEANERHAGPTVGRLVESMVFTSDKLELLGLAKDALPVAWWTGFKLDPATFAKVKGGEYRAFSIEGTARRVAADG